MFCPCAYDYTHKNANRQRKRKRTLSKYCCFPSNIVGNLPLLWEKFSRILSIQPIKENVVKKKVGENSAFFCFFAMIDKKKIEIWAS